MTLRGMAGALFMRICGFFPIRSNKVVFTSYEGKSYSDNPKWISEALKEYGGVEQVWLLRKGNSHPEVRSVAWGSLAALYELATAKVWVDNCRKREWTHKRQGQYYIQTWHGGVRLKKVEADAESDLTPKYIEAAKHDSQMADLFLSECEWSSEKYRSSFWYDGEILNCGIPKSDLFFKERGSICRKVYEELGVSFNKKLLLYAPTFRSDKDMSCYNLDCSSLINQLTRSFGGEWVIVIRLHSNIEELQDRFEYSENIVNGTQYPDMNELLAAAECLITDYSSCLFDGLRVGAKVFIYAPDWERYIEQQRELYFDLRMLPAPFADSNEILMRKIETFSPELYEKERLSFLEQMNFFGTGHASETAARRILDVINGSFPYE